MKKIVLTLGLTLIIQLSFTILNAPVSAKDCPPPQNLANVSQSWTFRVPGSDFWTSIGIINPGNESAVVTVEVSDVDDKFLGVLTTFPLAQKETRYISTANIAGILPLNTNRIRIFSDFHINAHAISGYLKDDWTITLRGITDEQDYHAPTAPGMESVQAGDSSCCGQKSSSANPYPCCKLGKKDCCKKKVGNCVWWCWKKINEVWGNSPGNWHNAEDWAKNAKKDGYPVKSKSEPQSDAVGVSKTVGHVAWVKYFEWRTVKGKKVKYVKVSEMNWCSTCLQEKYYPADFFDAGYILKKW